MHSWHVGAKFEVEEEAEDKTASIEWRYYQIQTVTICT